jgi:aryl-alcohol dehydrogenase-like predicted oxidoreductase
MKEKQNKIDRRNFLKTMGAAGLGSVFAGCKGKEEKEPNTIDPNAPAKTQMPELSQVPRRKLGKTGVEIPCLCLGGNYDLLGKQIILNKAFEWGINCWDTAHNYAWGNSELGIGKFLSNNPDARKKLFIVSKASSAGTVADVEDRLQTSLKRMNTNYIDLYYGVHFMSNPAQLTDELKQWARNAKKQNLIHFFGFSTHSNTAQCLAAAAKLDWIDAIMTRYSFRTMQDARMQDAVEACHKAGIGLIAIKTVALGQGDPRGGPKAEEEKKLLRHFVKRGFTEGQAKIKLVMEDKRFSSACVGMENMALLNSNIAAALNKTKLTQADKDVLKEYAEATCSGYCAGCAYICDSALRKESIGLPDTPYLSDIMRYLMYYNSYGKQTEARQLFAQIPDNVRNKLLSIDYSPAEARCPQHLPIAKLVAEAVSKLA